MTAAKISNVHAFLIDGVVKPKNIYKPLLKQKHITFDIDRLKEACNHFDNWFKPDDDFYRARIFCQIAVSSCIISASFTPTRLDKSRVLFFQAKDLEIPIGFFAPYLSKEDRIPWRARAYLPEPRLLEEGLSLTEALLEIGAAYRAQLSSLKDTASKVDAYYADVFICVRYFFHDPLSSTMTLSYREPHGALISRTWIKIL